MIVIPAIFRRSRYTVIAATMLFFALGTFNPLVRMLVESVSALRIGRFPEKFAHRPVRRAGRPRRGVRARIEDAAHLDDRHVRAAADLDGLHDPHRLVRAVSHDAAADAPRLHRPACRGGQAIDRDDYRERARRLEPLFGATAGLEYVLNRSGDGMHSLLSRIASERFATTHNPNWLRIATARPSIVAVAYRRADNPRRREHDRSRRARRRAARIHVRRRRARDARRARRPDDLDRCLNLGSGAAGRRPVLLPRLVRDDGQTANCTRLPSTSIASA